MKTLHVEDVDEDGVKSIRVVQDQKEIEWEVRKFYYDLYSEKEAKVDKNEILQNIEEVSKISDEDVCSLECGITEDEVAVTLLRPKNNVAPGPGGFGVFFTKYSGSTSSGWLLVLLGKYMRIRNFLYPKDLAL